MHPPLTGPTGTVKTFYSERGFGFITRMQEVPMSFSR